MRLSKLKIGESFNTTFPRFTLQKKSVDSVHMAVVPIARFTLHFMHLTAVTTSWCYSS